MSSRARSRSSSISWTTQVRPTQRFGSSPQKTARFARGSRRRFAGQRRPSRELTMTRPSDSRRYQTTAWFGAPRSPIVARLEMGLLEEVADALGQDDGLGG